ncbi:MAG: O-antigen ligase family protein [Thermoguttaceae bacterium]
MVYTIHYFARIVGSFLLAGAVLATPWLFRSSHPKAEIIIRVLVVCATAAALVALLVVPERVRRNRSFTRLIPAALILLAGVAIGFFQLLPHSLETLEKLSPAIPRIAEELFPAAGSEEAIFESEILGSALSADTFQRGFWPSALSVCTQVTKDQIAELIFVFAVFVSAGVLLQTKRQRFFLWRAVAINGLFLALLVIAQKIFGDRLPGYSRFWPRALCGPFVNRNGMAGYLSLCLAPAVSLLFLGILDEIRSRDDNELYYDGVRFRRRFSILRVLNAISDFFALFTQRVLLWSAVVAFILVGAAMTLSRGGTLAALFTFVTAALLFSFRRRGGLHLVPVWGGLFLAFCLLFWLGVSEPIQHRMGTLVETDQHESALKTNPRLDNWKSALQTAKAYHMRGTGLGTYPLANRSRDKALQMNRYFFFAENIAIETFVTAGIPGILCLAGEFFLLWGYVFCALRAGREGLTDSEENRMIYDIKRENADMTFIFGIGVAALLVGQTVSGSFDFGLLLYPNALAAALILGSFAGGRLDDSDDSASDFTLWETAEPNKRRVFSFSCAVLLVAGAIPLVLYAFFSINDRVETARVVERYLSPVAPEERDSFYFTRAEGDLGWAIEKRPEDPVFHYQLAQVYVAKFRHLFWNQLKEKFPETDPDELWHQTTPGAVYARMQPFFRNQMKVVPRKFRQDPIVSENLTAALRELWTVRRLCPFYPEPFVESAVIVPLLFEIDDHNAFTTTLLERIELISPNEPNVIFSAGLIEFMSGNRDQAVTKWKESLALSDERLADVTVLLATDRLRADFCRRLGEAISGDWRKAVLGTTLFPKKENPLIHSVYLELMEQILNAAEDKTSPEWYHKSAVYASLADRPAEALDFYRKATEGDPLNAAWHYEFGRFLLGVKRGAEAADEFVRASELAPENRAYRKALEK